MVYLRDMAVKVLFYWFHIKLEPHTRYCLWHFYTKVSTCEIIDRATFYTWISYSGSRSCPNCSRLPVPLLATGPKPLQRHSHWLEWQVHIMLVITHDEHNFWLSLSCIYYILINVYIPKTGFLCRIQWYWLPGGALNAALEFVRIWHCLCHIGLL